MTGRLEGRLMYNNAGIVGTVGPLTTTPVAELQATIGFTAGARPEAPGHAERAPMMREAGRTGL